MRRWRAFSMFTVLGLVLAACGGQGQSTSPSASGAPSVQPSVSSGPFAPMSYPASGPADCKAKGYNGEMKEIKAVDEHTVQFSLCYPDGSFLSKIAFSAFQIQDSQYLQTAMVSHLLLARPVGTGPYMLKEWQRGDHMTLQANPNYWGDKPLVSTVVVKWSSEAAQRLVELQAGTVDGIDNPGTDDFKTIEANPALKLYKRAGLNIAYLGFNNQPKATGFDNSKNPMANEKVRQAIAMGIDRKRIVDNFYPAGSTVADFFTPCEIKYGCVGDKWYGFDAAAAKKMLADAGFPNGFTTKISLRDVVRGYLPDPKSVAQEIQSQLKNNLGITTTIDVQESGAYLDNASAGKLTGLYLLGWGADYPDQTDFVDYHFGQGASDQFGAKFPDLVAAIQKGAQSADDAVRTSAYTEVNKLIKQHVPMIPLAHGASATAFKADVSGAYAAPLTDERFAVMKPASGDQLTFMQNAEPISLYCGDETDGETLRLCEQINQGLYTYKVGGTDAVPDLATECTPSSDQLTWTCKLRQNVKFSNGSSFDANDVVTSYALEWDTKHPLHIGRTAAFDYWKGLFGNFLNPAPPA
ncbi:MAG: peptide ABC transporter substrate-binding protein [Chloroflexi bacterium]|nr:MAG: peptide ABC transporter substrate-binding protein [Chloroflexota bacterium]